MITLLILSYLRILFIFWPLFTAFLKTDDANNFNPFIINNLDISSQSTNISEMPNENNENFERQKTQNIIIENKKEFTINVDIKNFELKKTKKGKKIPKFLRILLIIFFLSISQTKHFLI